MRIRALWRREGRVMSEQERGLIEWRDGVRVPEPDVSSLWLGLPDRVAFPLLALSGSILAGVAVGLLLVALDRAPGWVAALVLGGAGLVVLHRLGGDTE